jgi:hypothetical protein
MKPNHSLSFTLTKHLFVLTLDAPPPDSLVLAVIDGKNISQRIDIAQHTHVAFFETTLSISISRRDFRLHYWLLPANVCGSVSYWAVADHVLHFEVRSQSLRSDFCIFSQSNARTLRAALDYQSDATSSRVEFFSDPDEPVRRCRPGMICSHSSDRPFFIRFANVSDAGFDAKLNIIAFRRSLETVRCGIGPIPFVIEPPVIVPVGGLSVLERQCISMAEDTIKLVLFVCAVVAVGLTLLIVLHRIGCIDVPAVCGCSREQQRFDSLRENLYATQIAQELATPANPDEEQNAFT